MADKNSLVSIYPFHSFVMEEKVITLILTQDCQLACKYCYCIGKNKAHAMDYHTLIRAIDYSFDYLFNDNYRGCVIFDFIGGEPLLEIKLIQCAAKYIEEITTKGRYKNIFSFKLRICTNGLLYNSKEVQRFILEYKDYLNISISIDGNRQKNDANRIFPNGKGSYDAIINNVKLWLLQFPNALTRITISSDDIPFINESVLFLFSLGLTRFDISVIVEDVWKEGDDLLLENQLILLADHIIKNNLSDKLYISAFEFNIGNPQNLNKTARPCGEMLIAIDSDGKIYNCLRFSQFALKKSQPRIIGDIYNGIDRNRMRPLLSMDYFSLYPERCKECNVATGCKICPADCYDNSMTHSIYDRTLAICKMHKAKVRAKNYYWNRYKFIRDNYDNV